MLRQFPRAPFLLALLTLIACLAWSQAVNKVEAPPSSPESGKQMYADYCAACHGQDAKGNGPAAGALKAHPANLTRLAASNHGVFPELRVYNAILGDASFMAHGNKEMPVWGPIFSLLDARESVVKLRAHNLTKYLASLQEK